MFSLYAAVGLHFAVYISVVSAQIVVGGQVFTNALSIVDSPQPNTVFHAGSPLPFAVDISGDGKLSSAASLPNSGLQTSFESLEVYLVSNELNLTISEGPGLLTQEPGSTVKHVNWPIPNCVPPRNYNLTLYEASNILGSHFFSITPIPIEIQNNAQSGSCTSNVNTLQSQPQASNPPSQNPWLSSQPLSLAPQVSSQAGSVISSSSPATPYTPTGVITVVIGPSGVVWPLTIVPSGLSQTIIIEPTAPPLPSASVATIDQSYVSSQPLPSGGPPNGVSRVTVMVTPTETPVTVVFVSVETVMVPTTLPGETVVITSFRTTVSTATAFMAPGDGSDGFLPINGAVPGLSTTFSLVLSIMFSTAFVILWT